MERETVVTGYCRVLDNSRMVMVEADGAAITDIDCDYPGCPYAPNCPIGKAIGEFLQEN